VVEPTGPPSQPGWLQVILVAAVVVAIVLGASIGTSLLPTPIQEIVFHTPLTILILIAGTAWLLWRIARRGPGAPQP
jgi:heme A synthase